MAGTIKHRHQTAIAPTGADVDKNEWNDSLVVSGGSDKSLMVRDTSVPDGWSVVTPAASILRRGTRASQPLATAVAAGTDYVVTDEGYAREQSDGSAWSPASSPVAKYYTTIDSLANIANVATTLASATFTSIVNGMTFGFHLFGDIFTNAGGARTWSVIMLFGTTTTLTLSAAASSANVSTTPVEVWGQVYIVNSGHNRSMMFGMVGPTVTAGTAANVTPRNVWNFDDTNLYTGTQTMSVQLKCDSSGTGNFFSGGLSIHAHQ